MAEYIEKEEGCRQLYLMEYFGQKENKFAEYAIIVLDGKNFPERER